MSDGFVWTWEHLSLRAKRGSRWWHVHGFVWTCEHLSLCKHPELVTILTVNNKMVSVKE